MEQYIPKSVVLAEIEERRDLHYKYYMKNGAGSIAECKYDEDKDILSLLNTLEVKEVDFEKEYAKYSNDIDAEYAFPIDLADYKEFAKHFYELGLNASNPITAADRGTAEEIIINLKRVEKDYRINLTREIEWLRNKVKK